MSASLALPSLDSNANPSLRAALLDLYQESTRAFNDSLRNVFWSFTVAQQVGAALATPPSQASDDDADTPLEELLLGRPASDAEPPFALNRMAAAAHEEAQSIVVVAA